MSITSYPVPMTAEYVKRLEAQRPVTKNVLERFKAGAKTKEAQKDYAQLYADSLRYHDDVYQLQNVVRRAHNLAFRHGIDMRRKG